MNKGVLIANIQKIMTNIQQTIEDLTSMISKNNCYSKNQIEKSANLLAVKIQNDDSYKNISIEASNFDLLIKRLQGERTTLKKLISDVEFDIFSLRLQSEEKRALKSEQQKEYEILADSLNISENDEEIYAIMKDRKVEIELLQQQLDEILQEIEDKKQNLVHYNENIKDIEQKEQIYISNLKMLEDYSFDEQAKNSDINKLNILNQLVNVISAIDDLNNINSSLGNLVEYLGKREADKNTVDERIAYVKSLIAKVNGVMFGFVGSINLDECFSEKETIISRLNDKDSCLMNEKERKVRTLEIANLEFDISLCQSECISDEQTLIDYNHRIDKINGNIERINNQNSLLQVEIDELNLKRTYFIRENSQTETDDISKEIKKKKKIIYSNRKNIDKLIKIKIDIENAIRSIKKTRKNFEALKSDMELTLREKKELSTEYLSKYNLGYDKKQLLILDFIIEMTNFVNSILQQNYLKKLDEVYVETYEPFISVIGFSKYDKLGELVDETFVKNVKKSMETMINSGGMSTRNNHFIANLNSLGIKVTRYGKALKTMEKQNEMEEKLKILSGD